MRPRLYSLALILVTILAGLTLRFAHLGLPTPITKYGGSALWAMMIYWLIATIRPTWTIPRAALASCLAAAAIEFFKLVHTPTLDAFRLTLPGILLLGRFFSPCDLVAYCLAILVAALADKSLRSPRALTRSCLP